jgi:hypothetical protein
MSEHNEERYYMDPVGDTLLYIHRMGKDPQVKGRRFVIPKAHLNEGVIAYIQWAAQEAGIVCLIEANRVELLQPTPALRRLKR